MSAVPGGLLILCFFGWPLILWAVIRGVQRAKGGKHVECLVPMRKLLIAGSAAFAALTFASPAPAHADSVMCPSGAVAVVGGQTSCAFADNVGIAYRATRADSNGVVSIQVPSPATGQWYNMTCVSVHPAYCTGGNDAEVAVY